MHTTTAATLRPINATLNLTLSRAGFAREVTGGKTLAAQLEKIRHPPGGRTGSAGEKLWQMTTASLPAYALGIDTAKARQQIITDHLNSIPLAAVPGYGEAQGLGEVFRAGEPNCMDASQWLFRQRQRQAQDRAIRVLLEVDTFGGLHRNWQRLGYPFLRLVPSPGHGAGQLRRFAGRIDGHARHHRH